MRRLAADAICRIDDGSGVLVLTDMMGGTPSNLPLPLSQPGHVEVVAGVNLPMLMRALTYRDDTLRRGGRNGAGRRREGVVRVDNRVRFHPTD